MSGNHHRLCIIDFATKNLREKNIKTRPALQKATLFNQRSVSEEKQKMIFY